MTFSVYIRLYYYIILSNSQNMTDRNYYHYKIDFYNPDNTEILNTKYYLTSHDIRKELIMSEKTIYLHTINPFKGRKYKNLHIQRIREPVKKNKTEYVKRENCQIDILLNIFKEGYENKKISQS
jgi:hypothetical protein